MRNRNADIAEGPDQAVRPSGAESVEPTARNRIGDDLSEGPSVHLAERPKVGPNQGV